MKLIIVAGARPNFIKISPIIRAIHNAIARGNDITYRLVHTGQHYDSKMSGSFFDELNIPRPDSNLNAGGGTQAEQTSAIMLAFEKEIDLFPADLVIVVGDVTSTLACSIVAKKSQIKVAHIEAGIRSGDMSMPEEINRIVTDSITDYFFTTSVYANENLRKIGVKENHIFFVGNVMIDTLLCNMQRFTKPDFFNMLDLKEKNYLVMTLHRPANVDQVGKLRNIITRVIENSRGLPIIFPMHPRTAKIFLDNTIIAPNLHVVQPLGYLDFNYLVQHCKAVITDSGGITEETTVMNIPCLTLRDNTERPETVNIGTNELVGTNPSNIMRALDKLFENQWKQGCIPPLWDGNAAERIVAHILEISDFR